MRGFSPRNLKYMRAFAEAWAEEEFVQAVLAQITWYHNIALIEKLQTAEDREWYARATVQHGWRRNILVHQIESALHERQGKAVTNFDRALPSPQSDLAQQITKDPLQLRFPDAGIRFSGARSGARAARTSEAILVGAWCRLRIRGQPIPASGRE